VRAAGAGGTGRQVGLAGPVFRPDVEQRRGHLQFTSLPVSSSIVLNRFACSTMSG
jgi:hypothetical protein